MYCQTMFGISRENMLVALQAMEADNLSYFEFHCPKCRRANRVERKKLELANPNWQESLKQMAKEAAKAEKEQPPAAKEDKPAPKKKAPPAAKKTATKSSSKGKAKAK
jgi:hypothetical protein